MSRLGTQADLGFSLCSESSHSNFWTGQICSDSMSVSRCPSSLSLFAYAFCGPAGTDGVHSTERSYDEREVDMLRCFAIVEILYISTSRSSIDKTACTRQRHASNFVAAIERSVDSLANLQVDLTHDVSSPSVPNTRQVVHRQPALSSWIDR
jgi:hypothetical protein